MQITKYITLTGGIGVESGESRENIQILMTADEAKLLRNDIWRVVTLAGGPIELPVTMDEEHVSRTNEFATELAKAM